MSIGATPCSVCIHMTERNFGQYFCKKHKDEQGNQIRVLWREKVCQDFEPTEPKYADIKQDVEVID